MDPAVREFVQAIIDLLIIPLILAAAGWIVREVRKMPSEQQAVLETLVRRGVAAAEQVYGSQQAEAKKEFVYDYIVRRTERLGLKVSAADVENAIEASVYLLTHATRTAWDRPAPPVEPDPDPPAKPRRKPPVRGRRLPGD